MIGQQAPRGRLSLRLRAWNHRLGLWRIWVVIVWCRDRVRVATTPKLGRLQQYPGRPRRAGICRLPRRWSPQFPLSRGRSLPSISIVTPSFNQADFIGETIRSVTTQSYRCAEYFVQDGGSTDNTTDVVNECSAGITGYESAPDRGQSHAINLGFARTTGEVMAWLNSDDTFLPGTFEYVANYFARHPKVDVVYGHRVVIDERGDEIGLWTLPRHSDMVLSWADYVPQETLFWRRSAWDTVGAAISEDFAFACDWDLLLRFRNAGLRMKRLPRFMGCFRVHSMQKTSAQISDVGEAEMGRIRRRELGRPVDHPEINQAIRPYMRRHLVAHGLWKLRLRRY